MFSAAYPSEQVLRGVQLRVLASDSCGAGGCRDINAIVRLGSALSSAAAAGR
jgi:hypothetical protein